MHVARANAAQQLEASATKRGIAEEELQLPNTPSISQAKQTESVLEEVLPILTVVGTNLTLWNRISYSQRLLSKSKMFL